MNYKQLQATVKNYIHSYRCYFLAKDIPLEVYEACQVALNSKKEVLQQAYLAFQTWMQSQSCELTVEGATNLAYDEEGLVDYELCLKPEDQGLEGLDLDHANELYVYSSHPECGASVYVTDIDHRVCTNETAEGMYLSVSLYYAPACSLLRGQQSDRLSIYDGVGVLAVNYIYFSHPNVILEDSWVSNSCKVGIHTLNKYGEAYNAPACSIVCDFTTAKAFGHDPEAVAEVRVVGGYHYYEDDQNFIRRTGTVLATELACSLPLVAPATDLAPELRVTYANDDKMLHHDLDHATQVHSNTVFKSNRATEYYCESELTPERRYDIIHYGLHLNRQGTVYDLSYGLACELPNDRPMAEFTEFLQTKGFYEVDVEDYEANFGYGYNHSEHIAEVKLVHTLVPTSKDWGNSVYLEHDCNPYEEGMTANTPHLKGWLAPASHIACCLDNVSWYDLTKTEKYYQVTKEMTSAFTTASYKPQTESLPVKLFNETYNLLTSKKAVQVYRGIWQGLAIALQLTWLFLQLSWQGVMVATQTTVRLYKLATSPQAISAYDRVLTSFLLGCCNLADWASHRWSLVWNWLDATLALAIGLFYQPKPQHVEYFLD